MGACGSSQVVVSTPESKKIEEDISQSKKRLQKEIVILVLGAGECGKTTLCKHFQMINGYFTDEERAKYGSAIQNSLVQYMKILIRAADYLGYTLPNPERANKFLALEGPLTPEMGSLILDFWREEPIKMAFKQRNVLFTLPDCCEVLFNKAEEISALNYQPTDDDCLRVRLRTIGIIEYHLSVEDFLFKLVDVGGQRNARKKWIHCFDKVNCLLYCIALDDYSMVLAEDLKTNRMLESVKLFTDVVSIRAISHVPLIIFFNKIDMLREKIATYPLSDLFEDYKGGSDPDAALSFIKDQYLDQIQSKRQHYVHVTCALDRKNINVVFNAIRNILLKEDMATIL
mmetsp:Transcript_50603/g.127099  ORF Transcript_50603/g.127099 Transcript_50603/m.127099 type:complete len:343 (+) Transcript_50603:156-1184(+)